ncbi:MAG: histidine triad nucleotide-binding protein [Deltaproteobacteria bacterium]|nr:histidine triad nucleotide-binding protein [Deltaproteobacteria bacterium]
MTSDCIFCKILDGKIPSTRLAESDLAVAIADITPQAPVHALIIPRKHVASLNDLTAADRREILPALYDLADQLARDKGVRETGYRTLINNGESAGQTVFHLHMHVLAGAKMKHGFGA